MRRRVVIYTPDAGDDLDRIYNTIAEASSATTADRYDSRIRAFCERLDYGSKRGTLRDDVRPDLRVVGFERRVTVAFSACSMAVPIGQTNLARTTLADRCIRQTFA